MLKRQPFLGGEGPLFADYILFGALQWARVASPFPVLSADDPVADWFGRCLDLHEGLARRMPAAA
jgi:glutathione S-transferase